MSMFQVEFRNHRAAVVLARTASDAVAKAESIYYREGTAKSVALVENDTSDFED